MNKRIFNSGLTLKVSVSIFSLLLLFVCFAYLTYNRTVENIAIAEYSNSKYQENNQKKIKLANLLTEVSAIVASVENVVSVILYDYSVQNYNSIETDGNWDQIDMMLSSIETNSLDSYDDEIKIAFNRLNDDLHNVKRYESNFIHSFSIENETLTKSSLNKLRTSMNSLKNNYDILLRNGKDLELKSYAPVKFSNTAKVFILLLTFLSLISCIVVTILLIRSLRKPIKIINDYAGQLVKGDLEEYLDVDNEDFSEVNTGLNSLNDRLREVKMFADQISDGDFDNQGIFSIGFEGNVGESFEKAQTSLARIANEDLKRNHINHGLAMFSEILGNNTNNLEKFGDEIIRNLVEFLNANQGVLFVTTEGKKEMELGVISTYAYDKKKYLKKNVLKGQGLVGQSWVEGKSIYITEVPDSYVNITSGLGYSTPRCVLIQPLVFNDETHGVIELASFNELKDYEIAFVDRVAESIASALASVKVNTQTSELLRQSEILTDKMKKQEDEMKIKVRELRVTQEESQKREEMHLREIRRLKKRLEEYERSF